MTKIDPVEWDISELSALTYEAMIPGQTGGEPSSEDPKDDLLKFIEALATPLDVWWEITSNNWETALDPTQTPVEALGWLGQFVGVMIETSWTEAESRAAIEHPEGFDRGKTSSLIQAIQRTLTGTKTVLVVERFDGNAGELFVRTRTSETPSEDGTRAEAMRKKLAGLLLNYDAVSGIDFDTLLATTTDFDDVNVTYASFDDVVADNPV